MSWSLFNTSRILAGLVVALLMGQGARCADADSSPATKPATTVILIRHAERDNFFELTDQGRERARALVDAVGEMGITAILSPDLERNLDTVKPLADHLSIEITLIPRIDKSSVDAIVDGVLNFHRGETVLVVGNGAGNLRLLHQRLGGEGDGPYPYGALFVYTISGRGSVNLVRSWFGSK